LNIALAMMIAMMVMMRWAGVIISLPSAAIAALYSGLSFCTTYM